MRPGFCGSLYGLSLLFLAGALSAAEPVTFEKQIASFVKQHCVDCHGPDEHKAAFRIDELKPDFRTAQTATRWIHVHDKLVAGEMPPADQPRPPAKELNEVIRWVHDNLHTASLEKQRKEGRVVLRRLNSIEYENTLSDLFGIPVDVKFLLPEDNTAAGFDNISAVLDVSATHYLNYQEAAEKAIQTAIPYRPPGEFTHQHTGKEITEKFTVYKDVLGKNSRLLGDALLIHARLPDYIPIPTAQVPMNGRYRVQVSAYAIGTNGQTLTMALIARPLSGRRSDPDVVICRDVLPDKASVFEGEFELNRYTTVNIHGWGLPDRYAHFLATRNKGPVEDFKGPGLVVEWVKIDSVSPEFPPASYQQLFGDVPLKPRQVAKAELEKRAVPKINLSRPDSGWQYDPLVPASANMKDDAERLLRKFLPRAFRRPVPEDVQQKYVAQVHARLDQKYTFQEAMMYGYKAILASPQFLFLNEPGNAQLTSERDYASTRLDDFAIASRLSYFLWSSTPDQELLDSAAKGDLSHKDKLRAQVERMLNDPRAHRFTQNFVGQWLDLRKINATTPDPQIYNEYDNFLFWSLPQETELFFEEILKHDRSLLEFVDSQWTFLNERLAQHYGIANVAGCELRKVELPASSHRGGVMTHGSVLKVTADGTGTSPILRGKWVLERIVGKPPAPPPPDIPAIEPDIRGATTIRQQLEKHRNSPACNACHKHIDPPGFALETFDAIGGYRTYYRASKQTKKGNVPGTRYFIGPDVEVGGETPDGRPFAGIEDYKQILLEDPSQLARNLTEKLLIYATGADLQFADREVVEQIVSSLREQNYGFRTLIHHVVQSRIFLNK